MTLKVTLKVTLKATDPEPARVVNMEISPQLDVPTVNLITYHGINLILFIFYFVFILIINESLWYGFSLPQGPSCM